MGLITRLVCTLCKTSYREAPALYTCPSCGVKGILDVDYDYDHAEKQLNPQALAKNPDPTLWRYLPVLPVPDTVASEAGTLPSIPVGMTPLFQLPALAERLGLGAIWIKDDGRMPTGSFKDRASSVGALRALCLGQSEIACASTGNAASSLAGWSAHLGLRAYIFVPSSAPEAKVAQLRVFGATIFLVDGSYDQAWQLCETAVAEFGWYNRNCAVNPYLVEGKKTCGLELGEQLGRLAQAGDHAANVDVVAVSVGDGCTLAGVWKGLKEMHRFGHLEKLPRLLGVQAKGTAPIHAAWLHGDEDIAEMTGQTLADSINVGAPRNGVKALRAVRESGGSMVMVTDGEILAAMYELASFGVFGEPAGVAALAGIRRAVAKGVIEPGESVLHVVTGSGLKDVRAAEKASPEAHPVAPTLDAVRTALTKATRARARHLAAVGLPSYGGQTHANMTRTRKP